MNDRPRSRPTRFLAVHLVASAVLYLGFFRFEPPWKHIAFAGWFVVSVAALTIGILWMRRDRRDAA